MTYTVPPSAGDLPQNRFEFICAGEVLSLPKLEYLPVEGDEYLDEMANTTQNRRAFILGLVSATDAEVGAKVLAARLARDQVGDLYDNWVGSSRVTPGKSEDSEESSQSSANGSPTTS